ncbi:hypothetical protein [Robertkochia flava]|uniref:hypothetical protein n=1 Tax=Robertkochia flava TaxID=3447986 RepID=UPI001CC9409D|nr:hypothetical protein [Robertkochia marina]
MKKVLLTGIFVFLIAIPVTAQSGEAPHHLERTQTLDAMVETLYAVISGEKGEVRDWELFRSLFHPEARLIPSGSGREGKVQARFMSADDYIASSGKWLEENGFYEKEIHRETQQFGPVAHLFSTYESYRSASDLKPFMRGINSIQLMNDGERWWILNIFWTPETPDLPIPDKYLPKS